MKKLLLIVFTLLVYNGVTKAQVDVPNVAAGPTGQGSWLRFTTGGDITSIQENWGLNITGSSTQPVKIFNASLLVGYASDNTGNYGSGNAFINGRLGLGTIAPSAKLDVQGGDVNTSGSLTIGNNNGSSNHRINFSGIDLNHFVYSSGTGGNNMYFGEYLNGGAEGFHWINTQSGQEVMIINGLGNVGIGTSNPDAKLAVQGTIHATEIKVDQSVPTPDYVFDKDYDLATLKDVKTFIDKNHHLPEIPSAAQVAKDGINLGEMNSKLLKKIEELTLYLIEKDKQINAVKNQQNISAIMQQKQINALKKQLTSLTKKVSHL